MPRNVIIALLRNDLRLHDNAVLHAAHSLQEASHVVPLYVFDERQVEISGLGFRPEKPAMTRLCKFWKTGAHRARFLCEAVYDLRFRLRQRGSDLVIRFGRPEMEAERMMNEIRVRGDVVRGIYLQKEPCSEEVQVEKALERAARERDVTLKHFDTKSLVHPEDLPFAIDHVPDTFSDFRKRIEGSTKTIGRPCLDMPSGFKSMPDYIEPDDDRASASDLPGVLDGLLNPLDALPVQERDARTAAPFSGGETSALERSRWFFQEGDPPAAARYKKTRNRMLGHEYSTKLSPFLAFGCISPRFIIETLQRHESEFGGSQDTYWIQFELLWRDFFIFVAKKYGDSLFRLQGLFSAMPGARSGSSDWGPWKDGAGRTPAAVRRWLRGETGVPLIDANMRELVQTGYMSNRGRQNVASFLTKDLYYDWRIGAEFFESHLLDYDPTSNYGNWQYAAGVGNDPRTSRQFNPIKQAKDYDPEGDYVTCWLPELSSVPRAAIHSPWTLPNVSQLAPNYPSRPIIEQKQWKSHYSRKPGGSGDKTRGNRST